MKDLMRLIKEKRDLHGSHKGVEIKLCTFWGKIKFEMFANVVFLESYNFHVQIRVVDGRICIAYIGNFLRGLILANFVNPSQKRKI